MSLTITTTDFSHNYHGKEIKGSRTYACQFYTLHQIDIFNEIEINGEKFQAVYQTGNGFLHGDYNCPDPDLSLSDNVGGSGTSRLIYKIWSEGQTGLVNIRDEDIEEFCESLSDYTEYTMYTINELLQIYYVLVENYSLAKKHMESLGLSGVEEETEAE